MVGVGLGLMVGVGLGIMVGVGLGIMVGVGLGVMVGVGLGVALGVGVAVGSGAGQSNETSLVALYALPAAVPLKVPCIGSRWHALHGGGVIVLPSLLHADTTAAG